MIAAQGSTPTPHPAVSGTTFLGYVEVVMTKLLLCPEEVAEALGLGRSKVYELLASGRLRSVKVGRSRRVTVDQLQTFVAELESERV